MIEKQVDNDNKSSNSLNRIIGENDEILAR